MIRASRAWRRVVAPQSFWARAKKGSFCPSYATKDTLTLPEDFAKMEPRLAAFDAARRQFDPERRLRSHQSERLLEPAPKEMP